MSSESNTVEQMIRNAATKLGGKQAFGVHEDVPPYGGDSLGAELRPMHWTDASNDQVRCQLTFRVSSTGDFREGIEHASQQNRYREPTR
jgi:hypothetical protein